MGASCRSFSPSQILLPWELARRLPACWRLAFLYYCPPWPVKSLVNLDIWTSCEKLFLIDQCFVNGTHPNYTLKLKKKKHCWCFLWDTLTVSCWNGSNFWKKESGDTVCLIDEWWLKTSAFLSMRAEHQSSFAVSTATSNYSDSKRNWVAREGITYQLCRIPWSVQWGERESSKKKLALEIKHWMCRNNEMSSSSETAQGSWHMRQHSMGHFEF